MLLTTEGIVLHCIKYGESSVIVTVYTKASGRQSYIINAVRSNKARIRQGIMQPLFLVDLVAYHKDSRDIQRIKEIKNHPAYQNIPFDVAKSTQALFIAEILYKTLREEESSPQLFNFIKNALLLFDLAEGPTVNFHLYFLFRLTEYLGFLPDVERNSSEGWFDMRKGKIVPFKPLHSFFINKEATGVLSILSSLKIHNLENLKISRDLRVYLTMKMVEYYQLHFGHLAEIKSLKVLHEIFS